MRYKRANVNRPYKVPFGNVGIWVIGVLGIMASVFTIGIGYFPPDQINIGSLAFYEIFLVAGFVLFYAIPLLLYKWRKR